MRFGVALVAACLALGAGLATAAETSEVIVREDAPTAYKPVADSPIVVHALARHVSYGDLDLTTPAGAADLAKRVADSANAVCARLGKLYPNDFTSVEECEQGAVKQAMVRVRAAVARAERPG
jgi:UrcA family protein